MLRFLLAQCCRPSRFCSRDTAQMALAAALELHAHARRPAELQCARVAQALTRVDATLALDALSEGHRDGADGGRALALVAATLPIVGCEEDVWERVVLLAEEGLKKGTWIPREAASMISSVVGLNVYPPTFPQSVEQYAAAKLAGASANELVHIARALTQLPDTLSSSLFTTVSQRAALLADELTAAAAAHLCIALLKAGHRKSELLISVFECVPKWCEEGLAGGAALAVLRFCASHPDEAALHDPEGLALLLGATAAVPLTLDECTQVLSLVQELPAPLKDATVEALGPCVTAALQRLAVLVADLDDPPVDSVAHVVQLLFTFLEKEQHCTWVAESAARDAAIAMADCVERVVENLVSAEKPPFHIIQLLLASPIAEARVCGVVVLREAAAQKVHFTTLDTFRYLLALADFHSFDPAVFRHLRVSFCSTAKGIPMVQLCAALKCFQMANNIIPISPDNEEELQEEVDFLRYCHEMVHKATDLDVRVGLALVEVMDALGYADNTFYERLFMMMEPLVGYAKPALHVAAVAAACLPIAQRADAAAGVLAFVEAAAAEGDTAAQPSTPSQWMAINDPSNFITPMTAEQQQAFAILQQMNETRAADVETMRAHAQGYLKLLEHVRVNDIQFFFQVFADKVLKEDKLLNEALKKVIATPALMMHLPGATIASMLQSLGLIRFTYYATLKAFIGAITEEQWATIDAPSLVGVVQGMARLSLRMSAPLGHIGRRITAICSKLLPLEVSLLINSLQSIGYSDDAVLRLLMHQASKVAHRMCDVSVTLLIGSSSVHRLFLDTDVSMPILTRACKADLSSSSKLRLVASLKRSSLPRASIEATLSRLELEATRPQLELDDRRLALE